VHVGDLFLALAIIWFVAKVGGELAERGGQPAVLGELLAGMLIGPGGLGLVSESEVIRALAQVGVAILLFEIGLESDLGDLLRAGPQAAIVAVVGVLCPFVLGFAFGLAWGCPPLTSVFIGATLTATSVGITARVLSDLGRLKDPAARIVLGAAVIDDVLGLVILATVAAVVKTGSVSLGTIFVIVLKAVGFLVLALLLGIQFAPVLMRWVIRMRVRGSLVAMTLVACLLVAALGERMGLATIVGAFATGLVLARTEPRSRIEETLKPVADVLVPVFFVGVGMLADIRALNPFGTAGSSGAILAAVLTALAVVGKLVSGLAVYQRGVARWPVGVGMIPRGEVGLIFAGIGLATQVIDQTVYTALLTMVLLSTFVVPPWLRLVYQRPRQRRASDD
jgi:Kef-type K+ transport system membrane component KefB